MNFQQMILALLTYWTERGCVMVQPYDIEKGGEKVQSGRYSEGADGFVIYLPSVNSPDMAPEGHHAVTVYTIAPDTLDEGTWAEKKEEYAEKLLGQGDMLFLSGSGDVERVHGPFVSDEEVEQVTSELRQAYPNAQFEDVIQFDEEGRAIAHGHAADAQSDLYQEAVKIVLTDRKASTSYIQRKLSIGYNRAADLIERMEAEGVIGPADHAGRRDILDE